jgi:archaeal type IV pilus assembly protein PilA
MKNNTRTNDAVSPVIGVMLMLVVTIIIAAVVSGFVGGLASTSQKTPQMVLSGTYSQVNGLTISHSSGDVIPLSNVNFMTTPSTAMGTDAAKFAWIINGTIIHDPKNSNKPIYNSSTGTYETSSFAPGDTMFVNFSSCQDFSTSTLPNTSPSVNANARVWWLGDTDAKSKYFGAYAFGNPSNIGKQFYLDLVDSTGKVISRALVTIKA